MASKKGQPQGFHLLPGVRVGKHGLTLGHPGLASWTLPVKTSKPEQGKSPEPAAETGVEEKKSARFYFGADKLFKQGADLLLAGHIGQAAEKFSLVIEKDDGYADAYLALLYCGGENYNLSNLTALSKCAPRLGEGERKASVMLPRPSYVPLCFAERSISLHSDIILALASYHLANSASIEAEGIIANNLSTAPGCQIGVDNCDLGRAVQANVLLSQGQSEEALALLQSAELEGELAFDHALLMGTALAELGLEGQAENYLSRAANSPNQECSLFASYQLAQLWLASGKEVKARGTFEEIYATRSTYLDVADFLGLSSRPRTRQAQTTAQEQGEVSCDSQAAEEVAHLEHLFNLPSYGE